MTRTPAEAVITPLFRHGAALEGVPEIPILAPPRNPLPAAAAAVTGADLSGLAKLWFLAGPGGAGKTVMARWLFWRMTVQGRGAALAALDPTNRSLASWFTGVEQPPANGSAQTARWLRQFLEYLMPGPDGVPAQPAILDFGGGDTALERVVESAPDLDGTLKDAGFGVVACYPLTPRVDDLTLVSALESAGFQPAATVLLLNEGRADPAVPRDEAFATVTRHSVFRAAVARGAAVVWMPALESDVMREIEAKRLDFGMARDGQVPEGAAFHPVGGLRRGMVRRWLEHMETAFAPVGGWLP